VYLINKMLHKVLCVNPQIGYTWLYWAYPSFYSGRCLSDSLFARCFTPAFGCLPATLRIL